MTDETSGEQARCGFCGAAGFANVEALAAHELGCMFRPKVATAPPLPSVQWKAFAVRLEKKAHDTKKLADESFIGNSGTLVATAIMCVAKEAEAFALDLEKLGN